MPGIPQTFNPWKLYPPSVRDSKVRAPRQSISGADIRVRASGWGLNIRRMNNHHYYSLGFCTLTRLWYTETLFQLASGNLRPWKLQARTSNSQALPPKPKTTGDRGRKVGHTLIAEWVHYINLHNVCACKIEGLHFFGLINSETQMPCPFRPHVVVLTPNPLSVLGGS